MLKSLIANPLFKESKVFVFADGPKENASETDLEKIKEVKTKLNALKKFTNVNILFSETNNGLTHSIVSRITEVINKYGKVIVIEDDLELSPGFLKYMNDGLNLYEKEEKVMHIGGYMVPHKMNLPETFFLKTPTIWGWGTWKRAWDMYEINARILLEKLEEKFGGNFAYQLDVNGTYNNTKQLKDIASGKLDTWDIQWASSIFLHEGLCLHPKNSLTRNNGFDGSGVHCYPSDMYEKQKIHGAIDVKKIEIRASKKGEEALMNFYIAKNKMTFDEQMESIYHKIATLVPANVKSYLKKIKPSEKK